MFYHVEANNRLHRDASSVSNPCISPGPTIRMTRGQNYVLYFRNNGVNLGAAHSNIHTHGLFISGDANSDDITRTIDATSGCLGYNYTIPQEHAGGTFWYHSHPHGYTNPQVSGGALGMMVINDADASGNYPQLPATGSNNLKTFLSTDVEIMCAIIGSSTYCNGAASGASSITMISGQWYRVRFGASDPAGSTKALTIGCVGRNCAYSCQAREIARDGLWRTSVPAAAATTWNIGGASRIDLAVKCTGTAQHKFTYQSNIVNINLVSGSPNTGTPFTDSGANWNPILPNYMTSTIGLTPAESHTIQMQAAAITYDGTANSWNPTVPAGTWTYGTLVQLTVSASGAHPYHLHAYPMQVVNTCSGFTTGEWYDTISSTSSCTVRLWVTGHSGRVPMHCHFLSHEDNGAMTWVRVNGGPSLPSSPNPAVAATTC